ncbi:hypothetical protein Goshw_020182 [Gossypium schwendimanii]|uniref:Homeobox-leucine zipper protein n=1 Tax=Gossypium schwendimanii TaxID=34291 RepID=A0A7J9KYH2_GOSSC|nr:hypothetical protein [Gossypium schwendimanii]
MAGGRVYPSNNDTTDGVPNNLSVLLQNQRLHPLFIPGSSPSPSFIGTRSMVSFEDSLKTNRPKRSIFKMFDEQENGYDEYLEECFHQPEKKRRLTVDQIQFLEKSFEVDNKLEPERKIQLAKDLGLQPRQVAIWFQNRRARWKTKQLEKDYDTLLAMYNSLKADYDDLLKEKDKLKEEVLQLTDKLQTKENERRNSEFSDVKPLLLQEPSQKPIVVSMAACKQEDIDSDNIPQYYSDEFHSSLLEAADSSYPFEPDQSDLSQDEEDSLHPPASLSNFGFPVEDHPFWSWTY